MSAISATGRFAKPRTSQPSSIPINDVTDCVKSWGRRGIFFGASFGFIFGAIFVAIPFTSDVLTFGVIGTLLVGAVECAVIAGGFAALAAAIFANGVRGRSSAQFERILRAGRRSAVVPPRDVPLAEWPPRWAYPTQQSNASPPPSFDDGFNSAISAPDVQARLNTIDAWENGNTGP